MQYNRFAEILSQNREKIIWILLINSIILWLLTIATTHIFEFPPDTLYYTKQLPIFYWAGMMLNCVAFILLLGKSTLILKKIGLHHLFFIIILILYIFGIPSFIYANPRIIDVHGVSSAINAMMSTGGLITSGGYSRLYYLNEFPGASIFFSIICQILGTSVISFANYYPLYLMFMLSILIYTISKKITGNYALFAPVAYLSLTFVQEYNLAPQAHALILTAVLLLLIIGLFIAWPTDNANVISKKLLIIVILVAIIMSHPPTPIYTLICLIFILLMYISLKYAILLPRKKSYTWLKEISTRIKIVQNLTILFGVIYIAYLLYKSDFVFGNIVSLAQSITNNLLHGTSEYVVAHAFATQPASSYILAYKLRWAEIIGVSLLGLLSTVILFLKSEKKILTFIVCSLFLGYMSISVSFVIFGYAYAAQRGFIFILIPFSILTSMILDLKLDFKTRVTKHLNFFKAILILFVIISLILLPVVRYASDPYNFVSESTESGNEFTSKHCSDHNVISTYDIFQCKILSGDFVLFRAYWYNLVQLKQQRGDEFIDKLDSDEFNKLYDNPQYKKYQKR